MNKTELVTAINSLRDAAVQEHYYCEDCYYSCPKHPEGCCNEYWGKECNCNADKHNEKVEQIYKSIMTLLLFTE